MNQTKKHSNETRVKMSLNHANVKGQNNPMYGKKHTVETKEKIASFRRNKAWIYDPYTNVQKVVDRGEVASYLEQGWRLGRLKYQKGPSYLLGF